MFPKWKIHSPTSVILESITMGNHLAQVREHLDDIGESRIVLIVEQEPIISYKNGTVLQIQEKDTIIRDRSISLHS